MYWPASANQRLPSGPVVMVCAELLGVAIGYSAKAIDAAYLRFAALWLSLEPRLAPRSVEAPGTMVEGPG